MSVTVELRTEQGEVLGMAEAPVRMPAGDDRDFPMLRYVDFYGDTVFNRLQIDQVLRELHELKTRAKAKGELKTLDGLIALAEQCRESVHTYLWWVGD